MLVAIQLILLGHGQLLGSHEVERGVEVAHGHQQRVHGAAILQVAYHVDVQPVEGALRLVDAVEVEHALRGMLVGAVAGVDDGHGAHLGGILRCALDIVAHHYHVGIVGHHHDSVFQRLALCPTGHLRVGKPYHAGAKAVGRRLKREARAGAGFKEEGGYHATFQQLAVGMFLKFADHLNHVENLLARQVGNGYEIVLVHL